MGQVIAMPAERPAQARERKKNAKIAMPATWSAAEKVEILVWAKARGYSLEELQFATDTVRLWFEGDTTTRKRENWPAVLKSAMRAGWALKGFAQEMKRRGVGQINSRTGELGMARTPISDERIERWRKELT